MNIHIAIFKWKQGTTRADIDASLKEVEALRGKIPGIVEISTGQNTSHYSEGYTDAVLVRGESAQTIKDYRNHPDHKKVAEKIEAMEEHGIGVDFEKR